MSTVIEPLVPSPAPLSARRLHRGGACALLAAVVLAGCVLPPSQPQRSPSQAEVQARQRVRFEDAPGGVRATVDESILFKLGETTFANEAGPIFDVIKPAFDKARGQVVIEGHTDTKGSDALNMKLSQDRADRVRAEMIARNFPPGRLVAKGFGKTQLKRNPETTEDDARMNRRAEIVFIGETVDSLGARQVEKNADSLLDKIAKDLKAGAKDVYNSARDFVKSLTK